MALKVRTNSVDGGSYSLFDPIYGTSGASRGNVRILHESMDDDPSPGDCSAFIVQRKKAGRIPRINGQGTMSGVKLTVRDLIPSGWENASQRGHLTVSGRPSNTALATTLAARSNPSRSEVSVPTFLGELRDFPSLLKRSENLFASSRLAEDYVKYQFGWAPMVKDLKNMLLAEDMISKRLHRLNKLYKLGPRGGLRSTMDLFTGSATTGSASQYTLFHAIGSAYWWYAISQSTTLRVRGHIRWAPTRPVLTPPVHLKSRDFARRLVLGINTASALETAWNLMPWSWLIDYFGSVGDYLTASKNVVGASITKLVIMDHTCTTISAAHRQSPPGFTAGEGSYTVESKSRIIASPGISAYLPILSGGQTTILGALVATRSGVRSRK